MKPQAKRAYLKPEDVQPAEAQKVLAFLNAAKKAEEIAGAIKIPGERDVGIKVAQNILNKRVELGRFEDLKQVDDVPQVGPERFTEIVDMLGTRKVEYVIEGELKSTGRVDFGKAKLAVHAFVEGVEVARANVDEQDRYKLTFKYRDQPPATELRVIPAKFSHRCSRTLTLTKTFSPSRYVLKKKSASAYYAHYDLFIPADYLILVKTITKTYHMHGVVYAQYPFFFETLPGARIEFYEVDVKTPMFWVAGETTEAYLGCTYTGPDGSYDFEFDFSYKNNPWIWSRLFIDKIPDIRVRISQFVDGIWKQIYEGPVDWNIVEEFHRDYFVPAEDTFPIPDSGVKPDDGFRFASVGLMPIDSTRIVKGYATAQPGDPSRIESISCQPFCGTLRIFGFFAETPPVATYKVQIADADENGPTGSWEDVTDPLHNRKWNSAQKRWEHVVLGPDPATGIYQNIDIEPEADWHEHALKVTWNSANEPNGYYALRIIGYDAADVEVGTFEMPVVFRVDNDRPEASIEALQTALGYVTECGHLTLPASPLEDRWIRFKITAHDPEGHVLRYWISGTRGKEALSEVGTIDFPPPLDGRRPDPEDTWTGEEDHNVDFIVNPLPAALAGCPSVAYNFELHVHGLATDCYNVTPGSQRVKREVNLVVAE
jgi:hypothetical protein